MHFQGTDHCRIDQHAGTEGTAQQTPNREISYALKRWLVEPARESPWSSLRLFPGSSKTASKSLNRELDIILTRFQHGPSFAATTLANANESFNPFQTQCDNADPAAEDLRHSCPQEFIHSFYLPKGTVTPGPSVSPGNDQDAVSLATASERNQTHQNSDANIKHITGNCALDRLPERPPGCVNSSTPVSSPAVIDNADDLKSHTTAFFSLLATYGIGQNPRNDSRQKTSSKDAEPSSKIISLNSKRSRTLSSALRDRGNNGADSESEGERSPNQKRKKTDLCKDEHEKEFACPFYKLDNIFYVNCKGFGCGPNRIETVGRHVLGKKHQSSPHMTPAKHEEIKGIGVFKTPEARWEAMYRKIAGIHRDDLCHIPSPYHEVIVARSSAAHRTLSASLSPEPLPLDCEVLPPNAALEAVHLSPYAEAFHDRSQELSERYRQRRVEIRLQTAARIEAAQQAAISDERRLVALLWAENQINLQNLLNRYNEGLPPETVEPDIQPLVVDGVITNPANTAMPSVPPAFEASIRGLGDVGGGWSFDGIPPPQPSLQSIPDDSGYWSISENTSCTCASDLWCLKCDKPGSDVLNPDADAT